MKMNGELFVCVLPINNLLVFLSLPVNLDIEIIIIIIIFSSWPNELHFFSSLYFYILQENRINWRNKFISNLNFIRIRIHWFSFVGHRNLKKKNVWIKSKNRNEVVNRIQRNRLSHWTFRCATRHIVYSVWCHWTHPFSQRVRIG